MTETKDLLEKPKGGPPMSKNAMFSKIASRGDYLIEELFKDVESRNPSVRIAALRTLINKVLPDLKATELTGEDGKAIKLDISGMLQKAYGTTEHSPITEVHSDS